MRTLETLGHEEDRVDQGRGSDFKILQRSGQHH